MKFLLVAVLLMMVASGCRETGILDTTGPLRIVVVADRSEATVGQEVDFIVEASGSGLHMVVIRYGDGSSDVESFEQAIYSQIGMTKRHAYDEAGIYEVVAFVQNAVAEQASDTIQITITD